jgi:hypothetical protein
LSTTRRQEQVLWHARRGFPEEDWPALDEAMAKTLKFQQAALNDAFEDLGRAIWKALGWRGAVIFALLLPTLIFIADHR